MKFLPLFWGRCAAALLLSVSLSLIPVAGQQRRRRQPPAPPSQQRRTTATPTPTPAPSRGVQETATPAAVMPPPRTGASASVAAETVVTLETLFAADDYAVYGEVRSVGQLVSSKEVLDLLAPLKLPGGAPPEALELLDFFTTRAETLATSRIAFGAAPSRAKLPDVLVAIELSTPEQAEKLLPELREFATTKLSSFAKSTAPPDGGAALGVLTPATDTGGLRKRRRARDAAKRQAAPVVAPPPFYLQRSGALVALGATPFTFRDLRQPGAKLLSEEPGFIAARSRLSSETLFVYFNMGRYEQVERRQREEYARLAEAQRAEEARKQQGTNRDATGELLIAGDPNAIGNANSMMIPPDAAVVVGNANSNTAVPTATGEVELPEIVNPEEAGPTPPAPPPLSPEEQAKVEAQRRSQEFEMMLASALFSGGGPLGGGNNSRSGWPEAIGVGAALEGDAVVLRGLFVNHSDEQPLRPIPFLPIVLSGPALVPEAAGVLPADTEILVSASLDLPQMYDYLASSLRLLDFAGSAVAGTQGGQFDAQLAAFEKDKGFRIKEDLLNSLGNEIAISVPAQWFRGGNRGRQKAGQKKSKRPPHNSPVFLIALNDKKKLQEILPRALAAVGLAGISEQQLIEKRGNVELLTFTQGTVAFIEQFLVVAPDAETMRWIVDSYNERETLASSPRFRDAINWQPRQALGQTYISSEVLQLVLEDPRQAAEDIDDDESIRTLLARRPTEPGAITHVTVKDDRQLVHELRLPKSFLSMLAADLIISQKLAPVRGNESQARWKLNSLAIAQSTHKEATGRYASLTELQTSAHRPEYLGDEKYEVEGYEIKLSVSGDKFEATATPTIYRKTGRVSYYIDQTSIIRGGDLGGKTATAADEPVN